MKNFFVIVALLMSMVTFAGVNAAETEEASNFYPVRKDGKCGYINEQGDIVIEPQFDKADFFYEGYAAVVQSGNYSFIDENGKLLTACQYDEVQKFSEGKAAVKIGGKWGYIDAEGELIIPCQFDLCEPFSQNRAVVGTVNGIEKYYGYIDENGKLVVPCIYVRAESFSNGLALVYSLRENIPHFIDFDGNKVISNGVYSSFSEGLALWQTPIKKYAFINTLGEKVIYEKYNYAASFSEGLAVVNENDNYYFITATGEKAFSDKTFKYASSFHDGYAMVRQPKSIFNANGENIPSTPINPSQITYVSYIDHSGSYATDKFFYDAQSFYHGFAKVLDKDRSWKLINKKFEVVWDYNTNQMPI